MIRGNPEDLELFDDATVQRSFRVKGAARERIDADVSVELRVAALPEGRQNDAGHGRSSARSCRREES